MSAVSHPHTGNLKPKYHDSRSVMRLALFPHCTLLDAYTCTYITALYETGWV
jgi:hypothetical protein